ADAAAEAVEEPLVTMDVERRRLLAVKGTEPFVGGAGLLQRHVILDHDDDVGLVLQVVNEPLRKETHSVFQFDNGCTAATLVLRSELVAGDERMIFEIRGNGAAQLPGAVPVDDADRM